jgi:hypothetical protein
MDKYPPTHGRLAVIEPTKPQRGQAIRHAEAEQEMRRCSTQFRENQTVGALPLQETIMMHCRPRM